LVLLKLDFKPQVLLIKAIFLKVKKLPSAKSVAEYGYTSMIKGRKVEIHGIMNYIMSNSIRFIPRAFVLIVSRKMLDKS
jgi:hypothetical protein